MPVTPACPLQKDACSPASVGHAVLLHVNPAKIVGWHFERVAQTVSMRILPTLIISALLLLGDCSPRMAGSVQVLYQDRDFNSASFSGQSIIILPLLTKNGLDHTPEISPKRFGEWLASKRSDLRMLQRTAFETEYLKKHDSLSLARFYLALWKDDMLALHSCDSIWKAMNAGCLLTFRLTNGISLKNIENRTRKQATLETELWNIDSTEVIWRVSITRASMSPKKRDTDLVWDAMTALVPLLPIYRPSVNEKNW